MDVQGENEFPCNTRELETGVEKKDSDTREYFEFIFDYLLVVESLHIFVKSNMCIYMCMCASKYYCICVNEIEPSLFCYVASMCMLAFKCY